MDIIPYEWRIDAYDIMTTIKTTERHANEREKVYKPNTTSPPDSPIKYF